MIFNQYIHKNSVDSQKDHFSKKIVYIVKNNLGAAKCTTGATQPHLACSSRLVFRKTQIQILKHKYTNTQHNHLTITPFPPVQPSLLCPVQVALQRRLPILHPRKHKGIRAWVLLPPGDLFLARKKPHS